MQARQILERHLIIADKAFTMDDLRKEANNNYNLSVKLPTVRDVSMYIKIKDSVEGTIYSSKTECHLKMNDYYNYLLIIIHFFLIEISQPLVIL